MCRFLFLLCLALSDTAAPPISAPASTVEVPVEVPPLPAPLPTVEVPSLPLPAPVVAVAPAGAGSMQDMLAAIRMRRKD